MSLLRRGCRAGVLLASLSMGLSCGAARSTPDALPERGPEEAATAPPPGSPPAALPDRLTIEQAVDEALRSNLNLLAQRLNLSLADALLVAARVRPNPILSLDVDHVNVAHLSKGDLTEAAARVDVPIVLGGRFQVI